MADSRSEELLQSHALRKYQEALAKFKSTGVPPPGYRDAEGFETSYDRYYNTPIYNAPSGPGILGRFTAPGPGADPLPLAARPGKRILINKNIHPLNLQTGQVDPTALQSTINHEVLHRSFYGQPDVVKSIDDELTRQSTPGLPNLLNALSKGSLGSWNDYRTTSPHTTEEDIVRLLSDTINLSSRDIAPTDTPINTTLTPDILQRLRSIAFPRLTPDQQRIIRQPLRPH